MAKSESTAVNALIDMVRSGAPAGADAADDLFAAHPPRMTSTIPPTAAEVAPLPRTRAPTGTSQHLVDPQIRMTTAPPTRTTTIPPLPQARGSKAPPPPRGSQPPPRPSQQVASPQAAGPRANAALPPPRPSQQMPAVRASAPEVAPRAAAPAPEPQRSRAPSPAQPAQRRTSRQHPAQRAPSPAQPGQRARAASPSPEQLGQRPRAASPSPELLAAAAAQRGTRAPSPDVGRAATLPAPKRARTTGTQRATGAQRTTPPRTSPVAAPFEASHPMRAVADQYRMSTIDQTGDVVSADNWFEASRAVEKVDETWVGTRPAERRVNASATARRVIVPLVALAIVGFGVGYLVFHSAAAHKAAGRTAHVTAPASKAQPDTLAATARPNAATATAGVAQPAPPAGPAPADPNVPAHPNANEVKIVSHASDEQPAPAAAAAPVAAAPVAAAAPTPVAPAGVTAIAEAAPVVQEVHTAHGIVKLVDVRIDSKPSGATVMLVDNGKTTLLGTTPVAASVDPSRGYDVVLTLDGRPTQMTHLDPTKTQRLDVTLAKAPRVARSAPSSHATSHAETHRAAPKKVASSGPTGGLVDPGFDAPKAEAPKAAGGDGTLMVSSKPPCNLWIDGKDTGLTTPQRSISLSAGTHKVTFVNTSQSITKTVTVKISADQPTKLIQDLMSK